MELQILYQGVWVRLRGVVVQDHVTRYLRCGGYDGVLNRIVIDLVLHGY